MEKTVLVVGFLLLTASAIAVTNVAVNSGILEALGLTITGDATVSGKVTAAELHAGQYCDAGINCKAYADIGTGNLPACAAGEFVYMNASGKWDCYLTGGGVPGGDLGEATGPTGDMTTGGAAKASSSYAGYPPEAAFDGSTSTYWQNTNTLPSWLQYTFGSGKTIRQYKMYPHISYYPTAWKLEGSNDETAWNTVDTRSAEVWPYWGWKSYTVNSPGAYTYYRFTFTSASGGTWLIIYEIEMFDKTGLMEPDASDTYPGYSPSSAFDGSTGSYWQNMNLPSSWLEKDLGTKKTIKEYEMYPHISYYPMSWTLQGSNDGTSYAVLDTRASQSWPYWGWKSYIVAHPSAYRFYRWVLTGSSSSNWYLMYEINTNDYSSATNPIASDTYPGYSASSAFDGDTGTYWQNANLPSTWLQKDFGSAKTLTSYDMYPHISYYPTAWTVQGSTDGTTWTNIDSRASQSWAAWGYKSYTVATPGTYRFYRWVFNNVVNSNWVLMYEILSTTS